MRRWLYRILIGLGVLVVLVVVGVQIVFWSNLPRNLAIPIAERQLGLRIQVDGLSTGWFGHTTLNDVKLAMPLADQSFLEIKQIKVSHTSVFGIIFGRDIEVGSIELDQPKLWVRQNDAGRWNLQEVAELVGRPANGTSDQKTSHATPKLPEMMIHQAQVVVIPQSGEQATINDVEVHGWMQGPLLYSFEAGAPGHLQSHGRIAMGGDWSHEISLDVQRLDDWVRPWIKQWPEPAKAKLSWRGRMADGGVQGRLTVEESHVRQVSANGVVAVVVADGGVMVRPDGLIVDGAMSSDIKLIGGSAGFKAGVVNLDGLQLSMSGGTARLDGQYRLENQSANLKAIWQQINFPSSMSQSGSLEAILTTPWPGQPKLEIALNSGGKISSGQWDALMKLSAHGQGWTRMKAHVEFPRLAYQGAKSIDLHDLTADLHMDEQSVRLDALELPSPGRISGRGAMDLQNQSWWLWADGSNWTLPQANDAHVRFTINAWGNLAQTTLQQAYLEVGRLQVTAQGNYDTNLPRPLNVDLHVEHFPRLDEARQIQSLRGRLWSQVHLNGMISPLRIDLTGKLYGDDLEVYQRPVGDVAVELTGGINAEVAEVHSTELKLLDGRWRFDATYREDQQTLRVGVSVNDLPLKQAAALAIDRPAEGNLNGSWTIDLPQLKPDRMTMKGEFEADQVNAMGIASQSVRGKMQIDDGKLTVGPVVLREKEGQIIASANLRLDEIDNIHADVSASAWPVKTQKGLLEVWSDTKLDLNLKDQTATGPLSLTAVAKLDDKPLGKLSLDADLRGRVVNLKTIGGDIFGGSIQGQATVDLDRPMLSRGQVGWSAIDNDQVADVFPALDPLDGRFSGTIQFAPSEDSRALEPLRVTGVVQADEGHFRDLRIGDTNFMAFVGIDNPSGAWRVVLEHFDMSVGGGTVNLWARASRHKEGNVWAQANLSFSDLDLNQLVHAARSSAKPMPGKLSGRMTAVGDPMELRQIYAQGDAKLTDSDLANVPGFADLYNALHLALRPQPPSGEGRVSFRIDGQTLSLLNARYFNRGVEAFASGSSSHIWSGKQAGLDYVIVGTTRLLKNIDLPFMADMDAMLGALQGALTTMRVTGTIEQPNVAPMAFSELGGDILGMILGETKSPRTTAGR
ncbi:MAG: hypothetical protein IT446_14355 [Phycisphaerales bacterium]|nr:hypothetical protein [Phycisphaerales bacterium]